jgi:hypothetical protein
VNGSVLAPAFDVVGVLLVVAGETVLAGDFVDFDGDVPLFGEGVVVGLGGGVE